MFPKNVILNDEDLEVFSRQINGKGGWQSLLRSLAASRRGRVQSLSETQYERVARYAMKYGSGGWQDRLLRLIQKFRPGHGNGVAGGDAVAV